MKVLKLLLVVLLLLIFGGLGIVFFQNNIISHMTKTEKSSFINAKYSIKTNEILFDGFIVNGKNLGKGRVTVNLEKSGAFGLIPKIKLKKMKLENLDLNSVYTAPNALIDGFMVKITSPIREEKVLKTTEEYLLESTKDIENLNLEIENFINDKIKTNIEKTNKIKEDYKASTNLKSKVENLSELNKEASPLIKSISDEKEKPFMNLERIIRGFDKYIKLKDTDTIFITEPSYAGIEKRTALIMDEIAMLGANAVSLSSKKHLLHHASREDLMLMINLMNPKYYFPV